MLQVVCVVSRECCVLCSLLCVLCACFVWLCALCVEGVFVLVLGLKRHVHEGLRLCVCHRGNSKDYG